MPEMKKAEFGNSVDLDEAAYNDCGSGAAYFGRNGCPNILNV